MTLVGTATVWAAAGALIGAPIAWFAFMREREKADKDLIAGVENTLLGLEKDLGLVHGWASGGEGNPGYPWQGTERETRAHYRRSNPDWCDPRRKIFPVDWPAIRSFPHSPYRAYFTEEHGEFVALNYSLAALFNLYDEFRKYALARPDLYDRAVGRPCSEKPPSSDATLEAFREEIFNYNFEIHVGRIGGFTHQDQGCLYNAYRAACAALARCRSAWQSKKPSQPWWYGVGTALAGFAAAGGLLLIVGWFVLAFMNCDMAREARFRHAGFRRVPLRSYWPGDSIHVGSQASDSSATRPAPGEKNFHRRGK